MCAGKEGMKTLEMNKTNIEKLVSI